MEKTPKAVFFSNLVWFSVPFFPTRLYLFRDCILGEVVISEAGNPNSYITVQQLSNQENKPAAMFGKWSGDHLKLQSVSL